MENRRNVLVLKLRELSARRKRLLDEAENLRVKRDEFNKETKRIAEELKALRAGYRNIGSEISRLRSKLREDYVKLREVRELIQKASSKIKRADKPKTPLRLLKNRMEKLEWALQTSPTNLEMERRIVSEIAELQVKVKAHERLMELKQDLMRLRAIREAIKLEINSVRNEIEELRGKRAGLKRTIAELEERYRIVKEKADRFHLEFIEKLNEAKMLKAEEGVIIGELKQIEAEERKIAEEKAKATLAEVARRALEKLKNGGRVTADELKAIAEAEDMGVV